LIVPQENCRLSRIVVMMVVALVLVCIACAFAECVLSGWFDNWLKVVGVDPATKFTLESWAWAVLRVVMRFASMVPVSLHVTIELQKLVSGYELDNILSAKSGRRHDNRAHRRHSRRYRIQPIQPGEVGGAHERQQEMQHQHRRQHSERGSNSHERGSNSERGSNPHGDPLQELLLVAPDQTKRGEYARRVPELAAVGATAIAAEMGVGENQPSAQAESSSSDSINGAGDAGGGGHTSDAGGGGTGAFESSDGEGEISDGDGVGSSEATSTSWIQAAASTWKRSTAAGHVRLEKLAMAGGWMLAADGPVSSHSKIISWVPSLSITDVKL
jgi:hypothetical protein